METKLERIASKSANTKRPEFTSLYHLINKELLMQCHKEADGNKAVGIDEITKREYSENLEGNIENLVDRLKRKSYKPMPSLRVYIPKSNGKMRPLGIACYEDKIVQLALKKILEAIYEPKFLNCMHGFRANRRCHTAVKELDPLWMLNHYHYLDSGRDGKRKMTFSRYAGPGSHRYPVGFSGDTVVTWESLDFQPYFTATASNIGYGWWSHDIGGHMFGYRDDELTARWVQLGVFSPMNRLHSTDNPFNGKEPWKYNQIVETVMKNFLKLRHKLVPYLYTMNRRASRAGLPLVQPMYYLEPEREETYEVPNNYYFGTEMMVSPITDKLDPVTGLAGAKTWIPQGIWYDFFNGRAYKGGRKVDLWRDIYEMPVLVREGSIIPLKDMEGYDNSIENPEKLEVLVYPGESGEFVLWEDGGDTPEDLDENWVSTRMTKTADENGTVFIVEAAQGNTAVIPQKRSWKIRFCNIQDKPQEVTVNGQVYKDAEFAEDEKIHGTIVLLKDVPADAQVKVTFAADAAVYQRDYAEEVYEILEKAQITYAQKTEVYKVVKELGTEAVPVLVSMNLNPSLLGVLMEILTMGI